jgi:HEAT repeat protein
MDTMFDFIAISSNPSVLRDVYNIVERVVEFFIQERLSAKLREALRRMRDFLEKPVQTEEIRQFCVGFQKKLSDAQTLDYLTEGIVQWNKQAEDILAYLSYLGEPAVDTLVRMLQNAESGRLRTEICDQLIAAVGKSGVERIIASIGKEKREVAVASIYLASAAELPGIPASVKELVFYPDTKVREEMIKYLAFSEDAEARALLLRMLEDEEKKIRMKALGALEGKAYPEIRQKLDALAFDKELTKKTHDEQEAIFMILGSVGDAETVKRIEDLIVKKNKFFNRNRSNNVLAIRALEKIKEPSAVRLLEKLANDSSPLVQTQARRALGVLAKSMTGSE